MSIFDLKCDCSKLKENNHDLLTVFLANGLVKIYRDVKLYDTSLKDIWVYDKTFLGRTLIQDGPKR